MLRVFVRELLWAVVRGASAIVIYSAITSVPWTGVLAHWIGVAAFAALATSILLICGKFLYDTLFYDRFWRSLDSR